VAVLNSSHIGDKTPQELQDSSTTDKQLNADSGLIHFASLVSNVDKLYTVQCEPSIFEKVFIWFLGQPVVLVGTKYISNRDVRYINSYVADICKLPRVTIAYLK
jgi:hypothetical protein